MPPFLVPIAVVAPVQAGTGEEALQQVPDPASAGTSLKYQHYTNIHRMERLATTHALVTTVDRHKPTKQLDPSKHDKYGRATSYHQSPYDLKLCLGSRADMLVGMLGEQRA